MEKIESNINEMKKLSIILNEYSQKFGIDYTNDISDCLFNIDYTYQEYYNLEENNFDLSEFEEHNPPFLSKITSNINTLKEIVVILKAENNVLSELIKIELKKIEVIYQKEKSIHSSNLSMIHQVSNITFEKNMPTEFTNSKELAIIFPNNNFFTLTLHQDLNNQEKLNEEVKKVIKKMLSLNKIPKIKAKYYVSFTKEEGKKYKMIESNQGLKKLKILDKNKKNYI